MNPDSLEEPEDGSMGLKVVDRMDATPAAAKPHEPQTTDSQPLEFETTPREASTDGNARVTTSILIRRKGTSAHIDRRPLDTSAG
jgi:hypothetical protein